MSQTPAAPAVRIVEQPASKALRFRYECEGRSAGSIPGCNSTAEKKTYPTIEITGHKGKAIVVVSCVTKDEPYRAHPHNLVGRADRCNKGVCTMTPNVAESPLVSFANLGIQCVKRKDVADALNTREKLNVDPFKTGFSHKNQPQSIDLNAVRLCFQVFLPDRTGKYRHSLPPQVSDVIYDKKAMSDLLIMRMSCCSGTVRGGTEVILLCEKVTREDIAVVVFQKENDVVVWEENANVILVHKLVAIACTTPPYRNPHAREHVQVFLQLKRLSDNARSAPMPFEYIPETAESEYLKTKRRKTLSPCSVYEQDRAFIPEIKAEPRDKTPPHVVSPPLRMFPADPAADPYQQRWLMPMDNMTMNMPPTCQPMNWPPPNYPSPAIQIPNMQQMSPNMQQISPNMQQMSPNMQQIPQNMQQMPQNMHRLSPNMQQVPGNIQCPQSMSPGQNMVQALSPGHMGSLSPGHMGQPLSPGHHIGQELSPGHNMGQSLSPGHNIGQVMSPGHNMAQVVSPGHNMGQVMSSGHNMGQVMSPGHNMGQAMSPGHNMGQVMSPGHNMVQALSPGHNMVQGMSPGHNMAQTMPPMGHISPNLVQQDMNQEVGGDMEVVSECASLSALLREGGGDAAMLTSADLSQLLGLGRGTSELSNSLKELSTNDLLK